LIRCFQLVDVDTAEVAERPMQPIAGGVSWVHVCASADLWRRKTPAGSRQGKPEEITNGPPVNQQNRITIRIRWLT
jgi:hypothetical protein